MSLLGKRSMRSYRLPQGIDVVIRGHRALLCQVARTLDAHAYQLSAEATDTANGWIIQLGHPPQIRFAKPTIWRAFGETYLLAQAANGIVRLSHDSSPDQIWRLDARTVEIIAPLQSRRYDVVQSIYAAVRMIGLFFASRSAIDVIHAAAVGVGSHGVLLCGVKGAGKTTLSLALMARGATYIASDRTMAWQAGNAVQVCGWMGSVRIAPAALDLVLNDQQRATLAHYLRHRRGAKAYWFGGKFRFPPQDLLHMCGWPSTPKAVPRILVELEPAGSGHGSAVVLSQAETMALWCRHQVAGVIPLAFDLGAAMPLQAPSRLRGLRLQGRAVPQLMAERILAIVEEIVP